MILFGGSQSWVGPLSTQEDTTHDHHNALQCEYEFIPVFSHCGFFVLSKGVTATYVPQSKDVCDPPILAGASMCPCPPHLVEDDLPLLVWLAGRSGPAVIEICSIIVSMYHSLAPIPPLPLNGVGKKYDSLLKLAIPSSRKLLQCKPSYDLVKVIQLSKPSLTNIASLQIQSLPSKT